MRGVGTSGSRPFASQCFQMALLLTSFLMALAPPVLAACYVEPLGGRSAESVLYDAENYVILDIPDSSGLIERETAESLSTWNDLLWDETGYDWRLQLDIYDVGNVITGDGSDVCPGYAFGCTGFPANRSPTLSPVSSDKRSPVPSARLNSRWSLGWPVVARSSASCSGRVKVGGESQGIERSSRRHWAAVGRTHQGKSRRRLSPRRPFPRSASTRRIGLA